MQNIKDANKFNELNELQYKINYSFKDTKILVRALTHSSHANEKATRVFSNERLEFLGDSVLGFIAAELLYEKFKDLPEGVLTKLRAAIVCEKALYEYTCSLELGKYLFIGRGEERTGGRKRPALLADAFEALLAAVYLDGGMKSAKKFVVPYLEENIQNASQGSSFRDYKTMLQEVVQRNPGEMITYEIVDEKGPDHNKIFKCRLLINSNEFSRGEGRSKKDSQQIAAKEALKLMGIE